MYVVYSRSVYIFVICCVVHFDRWQEKGYNIWQVQVHHKSTNTNDFVTCDMVTLKKHFWQMENH